MRSRQILKIELYPQLSVWQQGDLPRAARVVRAAFGQRRKTLAMFNGGFMRARSEIEDILRAQNIDPNGAAKR